MRDNHESELTELDEQYHIYRVLKNDEKVTGRIDDIGITNEKIYCDLDFGEKYSVVTVADLNKESCLALYDLHSCLNEEFEGDCHGLVGREIHASLDKQSTIVIQEGNILFKLSIAENIKQARRNAIETDPILSTEILDSTIRLSNYDERKDSIYEAEVISVDSVESEVELLLDVWGKPLSWNLEVPDVDNMSGSKYEKVVERLGGGSPSMIGSDSLYVIRLDETSQDPRYIPHIVDIIGDEFSKWGIFLTYEGAENPTQNYQEKVYPVGARTGLIRSVAGVVISVLVTLFAIFVNSIIITFVGIIGCLVFVHAVWHNINRPQ